ncbi:MAG: hypothetical protein ACI4MQ_08530 [Candidatus Coproplasma sp.]
MKRKFLITLFAIVCGIVCMFGLVACGGSNNPPDETDKASQNAEFVEYRKKIVTILKDNGIRVNDLDADKDAEGNNEKTTSASKLNAYIARTNGKEAIKETVLADGNKQNDIESIISMREELFEQSFYISLYVGDALVDYFGQKTIYDIPVSVGTWNQYFTLVNKNNKDYVYCYSPKFYGEKDGYITACVDFSSQNNYSYTFIQFTEDLSDALYVYGNSQKEFFSVSYSSENPNNNYLYYAPNNNEGYVSYNSVSDCLDGVRSEFEAFSIADIKSTMDFRYAISNDQLTELTNKYFGKTGSFDGVHFVRDEYDNDYLFKGKKIIEGYYARDEKSVELPKDEEYYLLNDFLVRDQTGLVQELIIPQNIIGIVSWDYDEENPNKDYFDYYVETSINDLRINLYRDLGEGNGVYEPFEKFTVREDSPLFSSGSGHLKDKNGKIVLAANAPLETFDFSIKFNEEMEKYDKVFASVNTLNVDNDIDQINACETLTSKMPALTEINVTNECNKKCFEGDLIFNIYNPITINIYITSEDEDFWSRNSYRLIPNENEGVSVTVNMKDVCPIPDMTLDNMFEKYITVNTPMSRNIYYAMFGMPNENGNMSYNFSQDEDTDFELTNINEYNKTATLHLSENFKSTEITVPTQYYRYTILHFEVDAKYVAKKPLKLTVSKEMEFSFIISQDSCKFSNEKFIICYDGTIDELKDKIDAEYWSEKANCDIVFTAECSDSIETIHMGLRYNPNAIKITITFNGDTEDFYGLSYGNSFIRLDVNNVWELSSDFAYILVGEEDTYVSNLYDEKITFLIPSQDADYTLCEVQNGIKEYRLTDLQEDYDISLTVNYPSNGCSEIEAVITSGTVLGKPVYIEEQEDIPPEDISDEERFWFLQGVRCRLFNEFNLRLGTDEENLTNVSVKIVMDKNGELKLVYCQKVKYDVTITLCDGSQLKQTLRLDDKLSFDAETWKIESDYVYYLTYFSYGYENRCYLDTDCTEIDILSEDISLHRVALVEDKAFEFVEGDDFVSGTLSVKYDESYGRHIIFITASGNIKGYEFSDKKVNCNIWDNKNYIVYFYIYDQGEIRELFTVLLHWETAADGNITITDAEFINEVYIQYSSSDILCNVTIKNDRVATVFYRNGNDEEPTIVSDIAVSNITDAQLDKAQVIESEEYRYLIYIDVEISDDGDLTINGVYYKKEIVSAA